MRVLLISNDTKALDNAVKELYKSMQGKIITDVLSKSKTKALRRVIICNNIDLSVMDKIEVPFVVNISISF